MKRRMNNQSLMCTKCKVNGIGEHLHNAFFCRMFFVLFKNVYKHCMSSVSL